MDKAEQVDGHESRVGSCKDKLHLESDVPGGEEVTKDARAD